MEVSAAKKAAEIANNADNNIKSIYIQDSQAAIKAIISHRISSNNVIRSREFRKIK